MKRARKNSFCLVLFVLFGFPVLAPSQQSPVREITKIAGDLYRFRNDFHFSVFLVTPAGVIATDPINAEAARWLKQEIQKRFNQPVRYLVYSHDHADHISGGEVFADTALVIAHENAKRVIIGAKRPTAVPQIVFSDRMAIELGGKHVELMYVGRNHSDNSIVMRSPQERVLFAVDLVSVSSLPWRDFPDAYIDEWIESLKRLEALDFDIVDPGHGSLGKKAHVRESRVYMEELKAEVSKYARQSKSVEEIKQVVKMEKYSQWAQYKNFLPLNIEGMYRHVQQQRRPNYSDGIK